MTTSSARVTLALSLRVGVLAGVVLAGAPGVALAADPAASSPTPTSAPGHASAAPSGDAVEEAETHFRRGVELYKDGDPGAALVEFRRAYSLAPNFRVLYNLGQTYFQLQRYADALKTLQEFLSEGGTQIPADRRAQVEADVRQLSNRVGQIEIEVSADGAQVAVDDEPVGTSPLAQPVAVSVGHRKVSASKSGLQTQERFVDVAAGDRVPVSLDFPAPVVAAAAPPVTFDPAASPSTSTPAAAPPAQPSPSHAGTYVAWTVAGAFGVGTAVTGILALTAKSELSNQLDAYPGDPNSISDTRTRVKTMGILSDALLGATVVAGVVAFYVTVSHPSKMPVEMGFGPGGLSLRGRY